MNAPSTAAGGFPAFRGALLDMDGLVLDSESSYCRAWRLAAAELGCRLSDEFCESLFGRHVDDVDEALRSLLGTAYVPEQFHRSAERHWRRRLAADGLALMPGVELFLSVLSRHGIPYALATNSDGVFAYECLERSGVAGLFPVVVTRDQVRRGKPEPDVFLEAARRLGLPPEACIALEDSETGVRAAYAAGAITVLVQRREAARLKLQARADFVFASLTDVAAAIASVATPAAGDAGK